MIPSGILTEGVVTGSRLNHLCKVRLAGSRRPEQQKARPGFSLAREELRELDRQDDRLLQRVLRVLQPRHIVPLRGTRSPCLPRVHHRQL